MTNDPIDFHDLVWRLEQKLRKSHIDGRIGRIPSSTREQLRETTISFVPLASQYDTLSIYQDEQTELEDGIPIVSRQLGDRVR